MNRILSLSLIFAVSFGVYWTRSGEAPLASDDVSALVQACDTRSLGVQAAAACDQLLVQDDLSDTSRGILFYRKAFAYGEARDDAKAERAYTQSIAYGSAYQRSALHNRALIYWRAENWDALTADAERLIAEWPDVRDRNYFGALRMLRAKAKAGGDDATAQALALTYLSERPQDRITLNRRIRNLERDEDDYPSPDAVLTRLSDLTRAIAEGPDSHKLRRKRAKVLERLGMIMPSLDDHVRWIELSIAEKAADPDFSATELASLKTNFSNARAVYAQVQQQADRAVGAEATDADSLRLRARARLTLGRVNAALADLDAADALAGDGGAAATDALRQLYTRVQRVVEGTDLEFHG